MIRRLLKRTFGKDCVFLLKEVHLFFDGLESHP